MEDIHHADRLEAKIDKLLEKVAKLETLTATEAARCPFREDVTQIGRNVMRLEKIEGKVDANSVAVQALKMNWAKLVGLMVGAGAAGGVIADGFAKLFS